MGARYEIWWCNDAGQRLFMVDKYTNFSYSRTTEGLGTFQIQVPFNYWKDKYPAIFQVDNRFEVWRSPIEGVNARREGSFIAQRFQVNQRGSDSFDSITLYARSPLDILKAQSWEQNTIVTGRIDDIMKNVVTTMFVNNVSATATAPAGEFAVDANSSDGPIVSTSFFLHSVFDICHDLRVAAFTLNQLSSANQKIYFDVIEDDSLVSGGFGYRFRTFPGLRGMDRTLNSVLFSPKNGNLKEPVYYNDLQDMITAETLYDQAGNVVASAINPDAYLSRWHMRKKAASTFQSDPNTSLIDIYKDLNSNSGLYGFNATFLSTPGGPTQPRSVYGLDWDLGDLLPVQYAGRALNVEVLIVYIGVDDQGAENITGKNLIGAAE